MTKPVNITSARGFSAAALALSLLCASTIALAHGDEEHAASAKTKKEQIGDPIGEQTEWGIAGKAKGARTITIRMLDTMRFVPEQIAVKQGETIRFVITNEGQMLHEFVLGTRKVLDEHAALMAKFPTMEHSEPYMAHVGIGKTKDLVWTFNRPGAFDFACLIAGHYQAGMKGRIAVAGK
jgi:uncharacterized cupredoxin-like copper-binding protein